MRIRPAFAKINLALEVTGKRPDGYHDLDSVVTTIDWHDLVAMDLRPAAKSKISFRMWGATGDVPADSSNLAWQAASRLIAATDREWALDIELEKRIPAGAGLGGGSADAATVLTLGSSLLEDRGSVVPRARVRAIALELGSDVPVMLFPGTYRVQGRGEALDCLPAASLAIVVVTLSANKTKAVFDCVGAVASEGRSARLSGALMEGAALDDADMGSALESAAATAYPPFADSLGSLRKKAPVQWHVTGSGGAVFSVAGNGREAVALAKSLQAEGFKARAARTVG